VAQVKPLLLGIFTALVPGAAFAYIDPNAGGILFQILTPVFIAIVVFWTFLKQKLKALWTRVISAFRKSDP